MFLNNYKYVFSGGEDDDGRCSNLCCLLVALPYLLHHCKPLPRHQLQPLHSGDLPNDLLAGDVKLDVQPYDLLLYEPKVIFFQI